MKNLRNLTTWVAVLGVLALPATLFAFGGFVAGEPQLGMSDPTACDGTTFLTPSDGANLFCFTGALSDLGTPDASRVHWHIHNGSSIGPAATDVSYQDDAGFGSYDCFNSTWNPEPTINTTNWGIITAFAGGDLGTHEGWIVIDNGVGSDSGATRQITPQRLRIPTVRPGCIDQAPADGACDVDVNTGFDISFEYPTEESPSPDFGNCHFGGNADFSDNNGDSILDPRAILGYNVYRLSVSAMDPATTRPEHYMCGTDLDCSAGGDQGWVGFIALSPNLPDGITIDNQGNTPTTAVTNDRDVGCANCGDNVATPNPDIVWSDRTGDLTGEYAYVLQPVMRAAETGGLVDCGYTDYPSCQGLDLNNDGIFEFVDPSGNGLGLTANGASAPSGNGLGNTPDLPIMFVTADVDAGGACITCADGSDTAQLPALGSFDFTGRLTRPGQGIELSFLPSVEGNVVGFNLYRSVDGETFVKINPELISTGNTPLSKYSYTDPVNVRRVKATSLEYKVQVVLANGEKQLVGPYTVDISSADTGRSRRR